LKSHPILCGLDVWWSPTFKGDGDAAQEFHFDFDGAPIWVKYFVYLTESAPEWAACVRPRIASGGAPGAAALRARGYVRIHDDEIVEAFGAEMSWSSAGREARYRGRYT